MKHRKAILRIVLAVAILVHAVILLASNRWLVVYDHVVEFDNLPQHLHGLRVLQISDLHANNPYHINLNIWRYIDDLQFDVAVITGDIIMDGRWGNPNRVGDLAPHLPYLAELASRVPTFFVEGNHEVRQMAELRPVFEDLGIIVLQNEVYWLEVNGGLLEIVGTRDFSAMMNNPPLFGEMFSMFISPVDFRLVLTHQPQTFDIFKYTGQMLVLSGHTHGGQIRLPLLPTLFAGGQGFLPAYGNGFYYHETAILYVSRGIGTTYFPVRFWNRPEIAIFELR